MPIFQGGPRRFTAALTAVTLAGATLLAQAAPAATAAVPPGTVGYGYDAAGRLTSVTDTTGATRALTYDAVGNLLGVAVAATPLAAPRAAAARPAAPSGLAARPGTGAGRTVTITGRNLPGLDTAVVKIGGLMATVRSADPASLVAEVPPGLAGGRVPVTVTGEGGTATTAVTLPGAAAPAAIAPDAGLAELPALTAKPGVTAVSGRVRDSGSGAGLGGVLLSVDDVHARSGPDGRFVLAGLPAGHHELQIDAGATDHGIYEVGVTATAGRTTAMPWTTWLTKIDTSTSVRLPAHRTKEVVVTSPALPGLEVHVPAGSTLTGADGKPVTALTITKMPLERQVFPGAPGMTLAWTLQPGNATVTGPGLAVVYPNLAHQLPGVGIDYVDHDADRPGLGWAVYGHGAVTADGTRITPDADTRLHKTYQLGVSYNPLCKYLGLFCPRPGGDGNAGDPVDLQTGLFVSTHTDLAMTDVVPIGLTRTYRQNDYVLRSFGMGQSDSFNSFVSPDGAGNYVVQLPDGSSVPFTPTADPTVFTPVDTPTNLTGSRMTTDNHRNFAVSLVDGTTMTFGGWTASLVSVADRYGNATTMTRDPGNGRLTRVTSPNGRWIALTWGTCATVQCIVSARDNLGRTVAYTYDASGRLTAAKDVAGKTTTYAWSPCADPISCTQVVSATDPLGTAFVRNTFDAAGRVATQLQPDGSAYTFAYTTDANGAVTATTVTDPKAHQRQTLFDASGYTTSSTTAYGTALAQTTTSTRDAAHRVTSVVDPLNRRTAMTYDATGAMLTRTRLAGTASAVTDTLAYEPALHRLATVTNPLGNSGSFAYDDSDQTVTVTDPLGHTATTTLDEGQPVTVTDGLGHSTSVSYLDGLPVTTVDALGRAWRSYYDAAGRLTKSTDPLGNRTTYRYAVTDQPTGSTDALGNVSSAAYDADGRITSLTDALGHVTAYTYDAAGNLTSRKDALGKTATYTYDANGNVTSTLDRNGTKNTYTYDGLDRLSVAGYQLTGTSTYQSTITNTYDTGNRITKVVDTAGGTLTRTFDGFGNLASETTAQGSVGYTYDTAGRRTGMTVAGQPATTYTYDAGNRLTGVANGVGTAGMSYDAADRPTGVTLPGGVAKSYTLDDAGQLTGIAYTKGATSLGTLAYTYDGAGRRTGVAGTLARSGLPATTTGTATYNADNELTARGGTTFTYDAEGRLTADGTSTYAWNARDELTGVTGGSAASSYTYDPAGRRLTRTVGATTTGFVYDGPNVVQEKTGATPSANLLTGFGADQTFARSDSDGTRSLLTDALGSTVALADGTGAIATSYTYDPYGVVSSTGAANANPMQYTGRENDGTGLDYYRARYYSPGLQRFISQDPAGPAGSGANLYAYAGDAPTMNTDPSGNQLLPGCLIGAALGVGGGALGHYFNGTKYTLGDGLKDAALGCALGAAGAWLGEAIGAGITALRGGAAAEGAASAAAQTAARGGAAAVRTGQAGEAAVRGAYDIGPKATAVVNGNTRIFDGLNATTVSEVKNVASQAYTQQLKDSLAYAQATGRAFDLYVRPTTSLSGPLQNAISQGLINLKFIP